MSIPQLALLGFSAWTVIVLLGTVGVYRWSRILTARSAISEWRADEAQGSDWYRRAMRAHMNCVENLPVYASIVLCATAARATGPLLDLLAVTFLAARILQTLTHVSVIQTDRVTSVRFGFYVIQLICMFIMGSAVAVSAVK